MTEYTLDDCDPIFNSGGEVVIDHAQPGQIFGVVGAHTRLRVRHGGQFDAPTFVIVGFDAIFTEQVDHNVVNCKNILLQNLTFSDRLHFRDDPDTDHHSGGLSVNDCRVIKPNDGRSALKVTPAPGVLIDGVTVTNSQFDGGDAYLGNPHWNDQPDGEKEEIANVVFSGNVVRNAREGVQFKGAIGVRCMHNECFDLNGGGQGTYEAAYLVDDGTRDVFIAWNRARRCTGNGVHIVPGAADDVTVLCNLFEDCATNPYYPGVIFVSRRQGVRVLHNTLARGHIYFSNSVDRAVVQSNVLLAGMVRADFPLSGNYITQQHDYQTFDFDYRPLVNVPGEPLEMLTVDLDGVAYSLAAPTMGCYQFVPQTRVYVVTWPGGILTVDSGEKPEVNEA